jgi:hypothetical protein
MEDFFCDNDSCAHLRRLHNKHLVCGLPHPPAIARWSKDMRPDIMRCLLFKLRLKGEPLELYEEHRLPDGSYKGQLKESV